MPGFEDARNLTHELLTTETEARAGLVRNFFDITAVYGWHLTPEQAHDATEHVDDNSIVFVEGYMPKPTYAAQRLAQHTLLAEARLEDGSYSESTAASREALVIEFLARQHSTPTEHDFHSYYLYKELLNKGCAVLPADYLNLDETMPGLIGLEDIKEELRSLFPIESGEATERAIELDFELHTKWLQNQVTREKAAFSLVLYFLSRYSSSEGLQSLAATSDGKTKAFIIFGLAHRDSLTAYFNEYDIPIQQILVNSGDTPVEELDNLVAELARSPDEQRAIIRNYYLGCIASQKEM